MNHGDLEGMSQMNNSSIASLAILKVNWDKGHDYVDNFVPFALEAIGHSDTTPITVGNVQQYIKAHFGLQIPQGAINTLLKRVSVKGFIKKEARVFVRTDKEIETDISSILADALRQQRALFTNLAAFANRDGKNNWSEDDAGNALLGYLETEFIPILAAQLNGTPIPTPESNPSSAQLVIGKFIVEVSEKDPQTFSFLDTIAKGHMLATALFLPDIALASQKFKDLTVFLDTKILLRALGFEGKGLQDYSKEFLTLLYESNISLCCFDTTVDEVRRILTKAQHLLRNPREVNRSFLVYEHFVASNVSPSDVELIINDVPRGLQRLRIFEKERPKHTEELGIDENRLRELLRAEMPEQADEALFHDIDCLTAIHRLRKGKVSMHIETCKYLFVTPNNVIAKAGTIFFNEHYKQEGVPLCINDHTMATLAWVKHPNLDNGLQRDRLIATAYAAMQPPPKLWKQYLDEVERLRVKGDLSEDNYHLLRFSTVAKAALMESTSGEVSAFTEGTIEEILDRAKAEARFETETKLRDEIAKREAAEQWARSANDDLQKSRRDIELRLEAISLAYGRFVRRLVNFMVLLLVPLGMYQAHSLPLPVDDEFRAQVALLLQGSLFLALGFALFSQFTGGSVRELVRGIEVRSANFLMRLLTRYFLT